MTIFFSHSHKDSDFVDLLAKRLVNLNHHVWIDRWELNLGDSLIDKIQDQIGKADAVIVVLSKNSVTSNWCKKELNSALTRELNSNEPLVMACVIDDCEVPLFLQDKVYADFSKNPQKSWELLSRSLSPLMNAKQSRIEEPEYFTDWSVNWGLEPQPGLLFKFIQHANDWPYTILSEIRVFSKSPECKTALVRALKKDIDITIEIVLKSLAGEKTIVPEKIIVSDVRPIQMEKDFYISEFGLFNVQMEFARLGADNGMDCLVHVLSNIQNAHNHTASVVGERS